MEVGTCLRAENLKKKKKISMFVCMYVGMYMYVCIEDEFSSILHR